MRRTAVASIVVAGIDLATRMQLERSQRVRGPVLLRATVPNAARVPRSRVEWSGVQVRACLLRECQ